MSYKTTQVTDELYQYILAESLREPQLLRQLREKTASDPMAMMQIAPEQGQFMALLAQMLGVRKALEIGVFTGYSAMCIAAVLPADGRLVACDINEDWTRIAKRYWEQAGVSQRIDLRLAPALETLRELLGDGQAGSFDFAFIDADKENYRMYYEACLELVRPGGLIVIDNVLWSGSVADPDKQDTDTRAIRALNAFLKNDQRVSLSLVPIADGLSLALKR